MLYFEKMGTLNVDQGTLRSLDVQVL